MRSPAPVAPPVVAATVAWERGARIGPEDRARFEAMLAGLAPVLSEFEAELDAIARRAACGLDWLLPCLELTLPLYDRRRVLRLRMRRDDVTEIELVTRPGRRVGRVLLV